MCRTAISNLRVNENLWSGAAWSMGSGGVSWMNGRTWQGRSKRAAPARCGSAPARNPASLRNQQTFRKGPLGVHPLRVATKAVAPRHCRNIFGAVFVRAFRPDGFLFQERDAAPRAGDRDGLLAPRAQMHFDSLMLGVVARFVAECQEVKIRAQLSIDPRQKIQIESGGDPKGIVVSREQLRERFFQIRAKKQGIAAKQ